MLGYLPTLTLQGDVKPVFNPSDFDYTTAYTTFADLLDYANLYVSNNFTAIQNFASGIQTTSINGISDTTIYYLGNVTSDIQTQFQNILATLTNYIYDSSSDTQIIQKNTAFSDTIVNNTSNINSLLTNKILTNSIFTNSIKTQNLYIQNNPYPIVFLYYGTATYPLLKSGYVSNLTGLSISSNITLYVSISPNYSIQFFTEDNVLIASIVNSTADYLHYQGVSLGNFTPYKYLISRVT